MLQAGQPAKRKNTSTAGPLAVRPFRVSSPPSTSLRVKGSTTSPTLTQADGIGGLDQGRALVDIDLQGGRIPGADAFGVQVGQQLGQALLAHGFVSSA
jgi:hypothetical protein